MSLLLPLVFSVALVSQTPKPMMTAQEIYKKSSKYIVTISTSEGTGTGFIDNLGLIYTCYHVLDGAEEATVQFSDGRKAAVTCVVSADEKRDIARVRIEGGFEGLSFGDYAAVKPGERLVVIGNPKGLTNSVTEGLVSGKREMEGYSLLQLSAGVSPGSSGSPVLNMNGQVIGMVTSSLEEGQSLNFAISAKDLKVYYGVPLKSVFGSEKLDPGKSLISQRLLPANDDSELGLENFVGIDDLEIIVEDFDETLAAKLAPETVKLWLSVLAVDQGVKIRSAEQEREAKKKAETDEDERMILKHYDDAIRCAYLKINTVTDSDGSIIFSIDLLLIRSVIIYPGYRTVGIAHRSSRLGIAGPKVDLSATLRSDVEDLGKRLFEKIRLSNAKKKSSTEDKGK